MSGKTHRLKIGDITCIVLQDGFVPYEPTVEVLQNSYPNATATEINNALQNHGYGDVQPTFNMNALFIESAGTRILVDTGMGPTEPPHWGHIPAALQSEGIGVDDIDVVFITHFHGDHINGLLAENGQTMYPNSRYVTAQTEWDHWMDEATLAAMGEDRAADLRRIMEPIKDRFSYANAGDTLAPGVTLVDMAGHTPGHTGLLIESNGERLLDVVDLLHRPYQLGYPGWHFAFDTDGELAARNRKAVLARAADENLLTLFYHQPFPGLGYVTRHKDGTFSYQPI